MGEEKAIAVQEQQEIDLAEWRSREEVAVMGRRIKALLPGGDKLSDGEAMSLAQYSLAMGANPFRGEVYGFRGRNGFQIVEGYKLLSRWARGQCPYTEKYESAPGIPDGAIGIRCYVLRDDKKQSMREFIDMGATFKEAYELAATYADGVVEGSEMGRKPPTGWTWEQVARKRALKNALNLSHGAPSLKEIASETWKVGDTDTLPEDWGHVTPQMSRAEAEAAAEYGAMARAAHENFDPSADAEQAIAEVFGVVEHPSDGEYVNGEADYIEQEPVTKPHWIDCVDVNGREIRKAFWQWVRNEMQLTDSDVHAALEVAHIRDYNGDMVQAKAAIVAYKEAHPLPAEATS